MSQTEAIPGGKFPLYGAVYETDLDPVLGSETGKLRPAMVVSNDLNNRYSQTVTVLPITGQPSIKVYPFEVMLPGGTAGLSVSSRIKVNQIRTVDKRRLKGFRGSVPSQFFPAIDKALKVHLSIHDTPWAAT